jgi:hypothetical protein
MAPATALPPATAVQNITSNSCLNDTIDNCLKCHQQQLHQRHQKQLFKIDQATASSMTLTTAVPYQRQRQ